MKKCCHQMATENIAESEKQSSASEPRSMAKRSRHLIYAIAAQLMMIGAGCGGDSSESDEGSTNDQSDGVKGDGDSKKDDVRPRDGKKDDLPYECQQKMTHYCEDGVLYECASRSVERDCHACKWRGPGTGSSYDTHCAAIITAFSPKNESYYKGPGCYFGDELVCAPY